MTLLDAIVLAAYFAIVLSAAYSFKRFATDSSQFINGGGAMSWWMAGATAFMTQFSAWTFTGAASKAYTDGFAVLTIFWGNAIGFFIAAWFFAGRYRKLRVETPMQIIRQRFGPLTEQIFTWVQFPMSLIAAALWLNGLAYFTAGVFGVPILPTILIVGAVVTFIAASGGSWTVNATNVVQLVMLLAVTMVTGGYALYKADGPVRLIERFPVDFFWGGGLTLHGIFLIWAFGQVVKQVSGTNDALACYRFLVTRNEGEARRAAMLAAVLFVIGPVLWFIPPWLAAVEQADLATAYASMGKDAGNAAYLWFVHNYMPVGTLGLMLATMLAATVSPMSTMLNRNAGIFVRNVYEPFFGTGSDEQKLLRLGRHVSVLNGLVATAAAVLLASLRGVGLFDLMLLFGALLQMPLSIPCILAIFIKRTPDWAGWATLLFGLALSVFMQFVFSPDWLIPLLDVKELSARESMDLGVTCTILAHVVLTTGFFMLTGLFYRPSKDRRSDEKEQFFNRMRTALQSHEQAVVDLRQGHILGRLLMVAGGATLLLCLVSWRNAGAVLFFLVGISILGAGKWLTLTAAKQA